MDRKDFMRFWVKSSSRIYVEHPQGKCSRPCTTCSHLLSSFRGKVCFTNKDLEYEEMRGCDLPKGAMDSSGRRAAKRKWLVHKWYLLYVYICVDTNYIVHKLFGILVHADQQRQQTNWLVRTSASHNQSSWKCNKCEWHEHCLVCVGTTWVVAWKVPITSDSGEFRILVIHGRMAFAKHND